MNSMIFTNLGKKYMLYGLDPTSTTDFVPDRILLCTSEPSPLTESIDELTAVSPDYGFPADGWPAKSGVSVEMTVTWTLEWVVRKVNNFDAPSELMWLVFVDKDRQVLAYIDVRDEFVSIPEDLGKLGVRMISCQPFGYEDD